jgi:tRNA(adenine34) deaminase
MRRALELAAEAAAAGEVPVGAVVARGGDVIAEAANAMRASGSPLAHAEILAINSALTITDEARLEDCDLYVTLEPCTMCAGAISLARIRRLYYGATDPKGGAVDSGVRYFSQPTCHHAPEIVGGVNEAEASALLRSFFSARRQAP